MILFLFSGGVESTVLLKYFLKETNEINIMFYIQNLAYDDFQKKE
jgi:7-cyano-7-deazaguanine synthase in queuosine biosynthesis